MSNLVDGRHAGAETLVEKSRPSGRIGGVLAFAVVAFTFALVAIFLTTVLRNAPTTAADSDVGALYGP
jgi:hypothetical protein